MVELNPARLSQETGGGETESAAVAAGIQNRGTTARRYGSARFDGDGFATGPRLHMPSRLRCLATNSARTKQGCQPMIQQHGSCSPQKSSTTKSTAVSNTPKKPSIPGVAGLSGTTKMSFGFTRESPHNSQVLGRNCISEPAVATLLSPCSTRCRRRVRLAAVRCLLLTPADQPTVGARLRVKQNSPPRQGRETHTELVDISKKNDLSKMRIALFLESLRAARTCRAVSAGT